ncbi:MAG: VWA domain-containing protein [Saprospiraceae bacterium]|nr:VWA domain-containing protein [Saprospiraceae bacterium]
MELNPLQRWKLVLGDDSEEPKNDEQEHEFKEVEQLLDAVYGGKGTSGFGKSPLKIKKWLDGIRLHFPSEVVQIMQQDALERQGVKEMLLEPELLEKIEPSVSMVANILQFQHLLPDKTRNVARKLVQQIVAEIEQKIKNKLIPAIQKAKVPVSKPLLPESGQIDWKKTIQRNLRHYNNEIKSIIPEQWYGYRKGNRLPEIFILVDTSESMVESMIYSAIISSVLASLKTIETHLIFFNTEVSDLSGKYDDPVNLLFSTACGGGTDIGLAMSYTAQKIRNPSDCLIFLVSDLFEGGSKDPLLKQIQWLLERGASMFCLLSLSDNGIPEYDMSLAHKLNSFRIPCFACSPDKFAELLTDALNQNK